MIICNAEITKVDAHQRLKLVRQAPQMRGAVVLFSLAVAIQFHQGLADNRLELRRNSDKTISIVLGNSDAVAGLQFSVNARGGVLLRSYEGSERTDAAAIGIYQYLKDDSTLNVLLLAPVRSALPAGQGLIGTIGFTFSKIVQADTARVYLSRVAMCDAQARYLDVSAGQLVWNLNEKEEARAASFTLAQNFPNPFNPLTTIAYSIQEPAHVILEVYDIAGRQVKTLVDQYQSRGHYAVRWSAEGYMESKLASGTYIARLQVGEQVSVKKMIYAK